MAWLWKILTDYLWFELGVCVLLLAFGIYAALVDHDDQSEK
jgi:hypothetical protein